MPVEIRSSTLYTNIGDLYVKQGGTFTSGGDTGGGGGGGGDGPITFVQTGTEKAGSGDQSFWFTSDLTSGNSAIFITTEHTDTGDATISAPTGTVTEVDSKQRDYSGNLITVRIWLYDVTSATNGPFTMSDATNTMSIVGAEFSGSLEWKTGLGASSQGNQSSHTLTGSAVTGEYVGIIGGGMSAITETYTCSTANGIGNNDDYLGSFYDISTDDTPSHTLTISSTKQSAAILSIFQRPA